MWLSTRVENVDTGITTKQGPSIPIESLFYAFLRLGLFFEIMCFAGLTLISYVSTGSLMLNYHSFPEHMLQGSIPSYVSLCFFLGLVGAGKLMVFQILLADDTCFARGYVTGSKIIKVASLLDLVGKMICFVFTLQLGGTSENAIEFNTAVAQGGVEINFLTFGQVLSGIAFISYGFGFLLLELFQDEGVGNVYGYINFSSFVSAGIAILIYAISFKTSGANFIALVALMGAFIWASFFEPAVNEFSPSLGETELTNDVETQVEKFTRTSHYYNVDEQPGYTSQGSGYMQ
ncbi:hypothetical protein cand_006890 [Cryptosporidium andersoni]|uniref:Uncharacterized protein n=1 Tax=Cryptosporidium andersoni TaxID=117008 RepID=A0A1J4MSU8_9CRYT|nr:hypothetical protein cand_006890 [Cryptosporidium andersoni]